MKKLLLIGLFGLLGVLSLSAECIYNSKKKHQKANVTICTVCSDDDRINPQTKPFDGPGMDAKCNKCGCKRSEHTPNKR